MSSPLTWGFPWGSRLFWTSLASASVFFGFGHVCHEGHIADDIFLVIGERAAMNQNRDVMSVLGDEAAFEGLAFL